MRQILLSIASSLLCLQLHAQQPLVSPISPEGNILVETSPFTHAERMEIMQERAKEPKPFDELNAKVSINSFEAGVSYRTVHPGSYHHMNSMTPNLDKFETLDGSVWSTFPGDRYKLDGWLPFHDLVFVQHQDEFASYKFKVINTNLNNVKVQVNLILGPKYSGNYTYWITGLDIKNRKIVLCDNSVWDMSRFDRTVYEKWKLNQTIIIGVNDGTLTSFNPNILINVETLSYVRASLDN